MFFYKELIELIKVEHSRNRLEISYTLDINQRLTWPIVILSIRSL